MNIREMTETDYDQVYQLWLSCAGMGLNDLDDFYLENAGYLAQAMTLKLTDLGIAACWLTVNDSDRVKEAADLDSKLEVACVIGIGYRDKDTKEKRLDIVSPSNVTMTKTELQAAPKISLDSLLFDKMYGKAFNKEELYTELEDNKCRKR